ncbi:MAG: rhomboid family intramembrane serine protease [Planctomycetota bacterium]|jgi:membrane associated rhomboid family serine protease/Flp pilus assembly protein TadD|nr:rhomboid family intramembrane serine protease [Planctomycetota bacterium]MDP7130445.1 rhomboid family intramembrane serine protease [Planctomycetota bacterium]
MSDDLQQPDEEEGRQANSGEGQADSEKELANPPRQPINPSFQDSSFATSLDSSAQSQDSSTPATQDSTTPPLHHSTAPPPDSSVEPRPPFPFLNIVVLVMCLFMYWLTVPANALDPSVNLLIKYGAKVNHLIDQGQHWRLVTTMFLHGAWWHLGVNLFGLVMLGTWVESAYGHRRFLSVLVACGVAGSAASYSMSPEIGVGLSACLFGFMGVHILCLLKLLPIFHARTGKISCHLLISLLMGFVFVAFNLYVGWMFPQIDNFAHMAGLVTGAVLGLALPVPGRQKSTTFTHLRLTFSFLICLGLVGGAMGQMYQYSNSVTDAELESDLASVSREVEKKLLASPPQKPPSAPGIMKGWLNKSQSEQHLRRGIAYHRKNDLEKAAGEYRKAIELDQKSKTAYYNLALILIHKNQQDEAIALIHKLLLIDPEYVQAYILLADVYNIRGMFELAYEQLMTAKDIAPDNAAVRRELGRISAKYGAHKEALEHFREAIRLNPNDSRTVFEMGSLFVKTGHESEARAQLIQLRELNPRLAKELEKRVTRRFGKE